MNRTVKCQWVFNSLRDEHPQCAKDHLARQTAERISVIPHLSVEYR